MESSGTKTSVNGKTSLLVVSPLMTGDDTVKDGGNTLVVEGTIDTLDI